MADTENKNIIQAFRHAEKALAQADAIIDALYEVLEVLPEEESDLRQAAQTSFEEANQLSDHCGRVVESIVQLRLKHRALHSSSSLPPNVDLLLDTLARIEARRRPQKDTME